MTGAAANEPTDGARRGAGSDHAGGPTAPPSVASPARKRGAIRQVIVFMAFWIMLASVFSLAAYSMAAWSVRAAPGPDTAVALASASSPITLAVAAATLLATAFAVWIMRRWFDGPALLDLGLRLRPGWLAYSLVGLALGPVMFLTILLVLLAAGWATAGPGTIDATGLLVAFGTFTLVAFSEEILARGWILQVLLRGRGTLAAVLGSAGIFAVLHGFNPDFGLTALVGLFVAGLLFAQAYLVTRQLWLPVALHLSWNFAQGPIFGFPVSGLPGDGLLTVRPTGPEVITGGAFGPEAGLVLLVGIAVASACLYALGRWRAGRQEEPRARVAG